MRGAPPPDVMIASPAEPRATTPLRDGADRGDVVTTVPVSAESGVGLGALLAAVERALDEHYGGAVDEIPLVTRARHVRALTEARDELREFAALWGAGALPPTVAAVHVRAAVHALESLVGSVDVEEVLDRLFSTFCVGK